MTISLLNILIIVKLIKRLKFQLGQKTLKKIIKKLII